MEADFDDVGGDNLMIVMDSSKFVLSLLIIYGKEEGNEENEITRLDLGCRPSTACLLIPPWRVLSNCLVHTC